jgi:hypothetical protein
MYSNVLVGFGIFLILLGDVFYAGFYPQAGLFFALCGLIIVAVGMLEKAIEKLRDKK